MTEDTLIILYQKNSTWKWTFMGQTHVVQGPTVLVFLLHVFMGHLILFTAIHMNLACSIY